MNRSHAPSLFLVATLGFAGATVSLSAARADFWSSAKRFGEKGLHDVGKTVGKGLHELGGLLGRTQVGVGSPAGSGRLPGMQHPGMQTVPGNSENSGSSSANVLKGVIEEAKTPLTEKISGDLKKAAEPSFRTPGPFFGCQMDCPNPVETNPVADAPTESELEEMRPAAD